MSSGRAVVVGASHAGAQLVNSLRQGGWSGEILLVGDEPVLPYQRPPLSKAYLAGKLAWNADYVLTVAVSISSAAQYAAGAYNANPAGSSST